MEDDPQPRPLAGRGCDRRRHLHPEHHRGHRHGRLGPRLGAPAIASSSRTTSSRRTSIPGSRCAIEGITVDLIEPVGPVGSSQWSCSPTRSPQAPTRVLAVSWVQFGYGWRTDLAELGALCREHDTSVLRRRHPRPGRVCRHSSNEWGVDVGTMRRLQVDARARTASGSRQCRPVPASQLRPLEPGWGSVAAPLRLRQPRPRARRLGPPLRRRRRQRDHDRGMGASLDLLLEAGIDNVWQHVDGLCQRLADGFTDLGAELRSVHDSENRSAIVSFMLPNVEPTQSSRRWRRRASSARRSARCRSLAPHGYNTVDEIDTHVRGRSRNWPETRSGPARGRATSLTLVGAMACRRRCPSGCTRSPRCHCRRPPARRRPHRLERRRWRRSTSCRAPPGLARLWCRSGPPVRPCHRRHQRPW